MLYFDNLDGNYLVRLKVVSSPHFTREKNGRADQDSFSAVFFACTICEAGGGSDNKKKISGEILNWRRKENKREQLGESIITII